MDTKTEFVKDVVGDHFDDIQSEYHKFRGFKIALKRYMESFFAALERENPEHADAIQEHYRSAMNAYNIGLYEALGSIINMVFNQYRKDI